MPAEIGAVLEDQEAAGRGGDVLNQRFVRLLPVIPAKAGIHVSRDYRIHRKWRETWAPAFAGATGGEEFLVEDTRVGSARFVVGFARHYADCRPLTANCRLFTA